MIEFKFDTPDFTEVMRTSELDALDAAQMLLEMAAVECVAYLRSFTSKMQPPVRRSELPRPAHPGGWADVTGDLARGYGYTVDKDALADSVSVTLWNREDYAAALEAKDGYYVLTGITDPGGPMDKAVRRMAAELGLEVR